MFVIKNADNGSYWLERNYGYTGNLKEAHAYELDEIKKDPFILDELENKELILIPVSDLRRKEFLTFLEGCSRTVDK